jgi:uncharacterized protein
MSVSKAQLQLGNLRLRPAELVVLQSTTLCNLDCEYCCLPNRRENFSLSLRTLRAVIENLSVDGLISSDATICWHLGEPLLLPIEYYRSAHATIREILPFNVRFQFQTNGVHLNDEWCSFFNEEEARIGISLDGSQGEHDSRRVDWKRGQSFDKVISGLRSLQENDVEYHVIAVLSDEALADAGKFYDSFVEMGVRRLCLNVVESEGKGIPSFLSDDRVFSRITRFYSDLWRRVASETAPIWIREIEHSQEAVFLKPTTVSRSQEMEAGLVTSVLWNGDLLPYTPGFATVRRDDLGNFILGNVATAPLSKQHNKAVAEFLASSVERLFQSCKTQCEFFEVCGGGSPAHRWAEQRSFTDHVTRTCRASIQARARGVIDGMLQALPSRSKI